MKMINNRWKKYIQSGCFPKQFEHNELSKLGWIQVYSKGNENIYFEYKENNQILKGFFKVY